MDVLIDIKNYLPHRQPFLMVDMIHKMDETTVETVFEIKSDNIFINNGFFAEAGLIENAAQTCSAIVAKDFFIENNTDKKAVEVIGFISAIKKLQVFSLPKSGTTITTKSTLISNFITEDYSLCTMNCKTFDGEKLLLDGEINLFIQEKPAGSNAKPAETK